MEPHPHGWLSLLPPLVAIALAIVTRRVVLSLILGILAGALVTCGGNVQQAIRDTWEIHLWNTLIDPGKLRVFSFTLLMGATIGVISRSGGMHGLVEVVTPFARTRRRAQATTWLLGHLIFFDDYANTLLLGFTLRPLFDRLKISREKLAYLVDSTSAPVAGLAIVSTWVAVEIDFIAEGIRVIGNPSNLQAFDLFLASIPYRFYVLMALVMVAAISFSGRDFGPMLRVERQRLLSTSSDSEGSGYSSDDTLEVASPHRWYNAVIPIVVILAVVVWLIIKTGRESLEVADAQAAVAAVAAEEPAHAAEASFSWSRLRQIFGQGDSSLALQYAALCGLLVACLLAGIQRLLSFDQMVGAAETGARLVLPALLILWTASTLSRMTGREAYDGRPAESTYAFRDHRLYTGEYLKQLLIKEAPSAVDAQQSGSQPSPSSRVPTWFIPTVVFLLSSFVAFCTGTSWGTMGILMPMVVALSHAVLTVGGATLSEADPILLCCIGGVLAGSIFGDHCSPISDTTVLSSQSSGCDHIAHVWTQMPYAVIVGIVTILLGTIPVGLGFPVWILLVLQLIALILIVVLVGSKTERGSQPQ